MIAAIAIVVAVVGGGGNSFRGRRRREFDVDISPNIPLQDGILRIKKFALFDIQENSIPVVTRISTMMPMMIVVGDTVPVRLVVVLVVPVHAGGG